MLSPTNIMLALCLLRKNTYCTLYVMDYIFKTSCGGVWKNMIPGDGISSHYLVVITIMILNDVSSTFTNFFLLLHKGGFPHIFLYSSSWMILRPLWYFSVWFIHCFAHSDFSTIITGDVIKFSLGFLFVLFCFTFIIPSFPTLCEHKLVSYLDRLL